MEQIYVLQCEKNKYYVGKTHDVMRRYEEHCSGKGSSWTNKYKPVKLLECKAMITQHDENNITKDYMKKHGIEHVRGGIFTQVILPEDVVSVLQREFQGTMDICYKCNLAGHFATRCPNVHKQVEYAAKTNQSVELVKSDEDKLQINIKPTTNWHGSFGSLVGLTAGLATGILATTNEIITNVVESKETYVCGNCVRTFDTKYGRMIHERSCKKKLLDSPLPTTMVVLDSTTVSSNSVKKTGKCYKCGRGGHYSPDCYAKTHIDGHQLD